MMNVVKFKMRKKIDYDVSISGQYWAELRDVITDMVPDNLSPMPFKQIIKHAKLGMCEDQVRCLK